MYRVGVDIPAGEYLVKPNRKSKGSSLCSVYKNPKKIEDSWLFCTQGYIVIKQGEYLKVSPDENGMKLIFTPVG
jgi:hypothetical protein